MTFKLTQNKYRMGQDYKLHVSESWLTLFNVQCSCLDETLAGIPKRRSSIIKQESICYVNVNVKDPLDINVKGYDP